MPFAPFAGRASARFFRVFVIRDLGGVEFLIPIRAVPAPVGAAVSTLSQVVLREHQKSVFHVVVDTLNQLAVNHCAPASRNRALRSSGSTGTPSRNLTNFPEMAATRSPGTMNPIRLSGSAADRPTDVSPVAADCAWPAATQPPRAAQIVRPENR